jgi:outer membrane lipopolysaccharide assembly protein LptE/RlpB
MKRNQNPGLVYKGVSIALLLLFTGCGYHLAGSKGNLPGGIKSLGIPAFKNLTREYKLEQQITTAVLKEFTLRTRIPVNSQSAGVDAVLQGEIHTLSASPITFGSDAFASAFVVTVNMSVRLVRVKDNSVLFENPSFVFQERYVMNSKVTQFFSEENTAVDRLARDFAASLASAILTR